MKTSDKKGIIISILIGLFLIAIISVMMVYFVSNTRNNLILMEESEANADKISFAIQPSAAFIPLYIAKEEGWIDQEMSAKGVTVEWHNFDAGPAINESMLKRESDIGVLGDVPTVFAIGMGQDNVIICTAAQAADSYAVLVAYDSDIQTAADLKGRRLATIIGTTAHNLTDKYLATAGLTLSDISFVNITAGDAASTLADGRADAIAVWEPSVTRIADSGVGRIIGEGSDCGLAGTNTLVARRSFAEDNPELIKIVNEQYRRAAQALADGSVSEETLQAVADYMKLDVDQLLSLVPKFQYTVDIADEDIEALNDTISFLYKVNQLPDTYDIGDYVFVP